MPPPPSSREGKRRSVVHFHGNGEAGDDPLASQRIQSAADLSDVGATLTALEEHVKQNAFLFQSQTIHKVAMGSFSLGGGGSSSSGVGASTSTLSAQDQMLRQQQEEAASARKRQALLTQVRSQLDMKRKRDSLNGEGTAAEGIDCAPNPSPFLASKGKDQHEISAVIDVADAHLFSPALVAMMPPPSSPTSPGRRGLHEAPRIAIPESLIASHATAEFESMMLARLNPEASINNIHTNSGDSPRTASTTGGGGILRHPTLVPVSQYVRTQLEALRFSSDHGFHYHEHFDLHVNAAVERRRATLAAQPAHRLCSVNFLEENRKAVKDATPASLVEKALHERTITAQRNTEYTAQMEEWFATQIEMRRDIAETNRRRQQEEKRRRGSRRGEDGMDDASDGDNSSVHKEGDSASSPFAALHFGSLTSEREIALVVQRIWLIMVTLGVRSRFFVAAGDQILRRRREEEEKDLHRILLNTEHMTALLALDTMKKKYETCRTIMRQYVQRRMQKKHSASVDLIVRVLRHRHRIARTLFQVRWYRRCVMTTQRQVRIWLQSLAARRLLLHLQWVRKECELLQIPNGALDALQQQWNEQRKMIDTTRLIASEIQRDIARRGLAAAGTGGQNNQNQNQPLQPSSSGNANANARKNESVKTQGNARSGAGHGGTSSSSNNNTVGSEGLPLVRPGGPGFVIWDTRLLYVPPGGVPFEYRVAQVQLSCQSLLRAFLSSLVSAEANRKFFVKQRARYETDGLGALGLPPPKPPSAPIFNLLVPRMALHMRVRTAVKEKGGQKSDIKLLSKSGSTAASILINKQQRGGGTVSVIGASTGAAADAEAAELPPGHSAMDLDRRHASVILKAPRQAEAMDDTSSRSQDTNPFSPRRPPGALNPSASFVSRVQVRDGSVAAAAAGGGGGNSPNRTASSAPASPVRQQSSNALLRREESLAASPPELSRGGSSRSVYEHFDAITDEKDALPTTVRSDAEYAKLLGKSSVHHMRNFLDTGNTLHLRQRQDSTASSSRTSSERGLVPNSTARTIRAPRHGNDASSNQQPSVPLHLSNINKHYQDEATKVFADRYHTTTGGSGDHSDMGTQQTQTNHGGQLTPQRTARHLLPNPGPHGTDLPTHHQHTAPRVPQLPSRKVARSSGTGDDIRTQLVDKDLPSHRPFAPGAITIRQHEERLKPKTAFEEIPMTGLDARVGNPLPMGYDVERDVPRLLAFSGSSDAQRRLMACGGTQYRASAVSGGAKQQSRSLYDDSSDITAVSLLTTAAESHARSVQKSRALRFM